MHIQISAPFIVHNKTRLDIIALRPIEGLIQNNRKRIQYLKILKQTQSQSYKDTVHFQWHGEQVWVRQDQIRGLGPILTGDSQSAGLMHLVCGKEQQQHCDKTTANTEVKNSKPFSQGLLS